MFKSLKGLTIEGKGRGNLQHRYLVGLVIGSYLEHTRLRCSEVITDFDLLVLWFSAIYLRVVILSERIV